MHYYLQTVVGALDCIHVKIKMPSIFGDEYIIARVMCQCYSQAMCDSEEMFTSINAELWAQCKNIGND